MNIICEQCFTIFNITSVNLWRIEDDHLRCIASKGVEAALIGTNINPHQQENYLVSQIFHTNKPFYQNNFAQAAESLPELNINTKHIAVMGIPLLKQNKPLGVLFLLNTQSTGNFSSDDQSRAMIYGNHVITAIENARLFQDLQQHTKNLEQALVELKELNRLQAEFVQNVSHELRTPLTFIQGYVDLILEGSLGKVPESVKSSLNIVSRRTADLSRLVNDIITHQQVQMDTLKLKETNLIEVIKLATSSAMPTAQRNNITLITTMPKTLPTVKIDPHRIGQVFDNLIGNAIKFTRTGGLITVSATLLDSSIKVSVVDTGIGITATELPKIFSRFYQADGSTTRRYGGTGLGLTITKQIIEAHHGSIEVASEKGKGTEFTFTLPLHQPEV